MNKIARTPKLAPFKTTGSLSEIYYNGIQFSMVRVNKAGNLQQCFPWVLCKDFFNEALCGYLHDTTKKIYRFSYGPKNPRLDLSNFYVLMRDKSATDVASKKAFVEKARRARIFMRAVDRSAKFTQTEMKSLGDGVVLFIMDTRWTHATPLMSLSLCLLRIGLLYPKGARSVTKFLAEAVKGVDRAYSPSSVVRQRNNDLNYVKAVLEAGNLVPLIKQNVGLFDPDQKKNYPATTDVYNLHEAGFVRWNGFQRGDSVATELSSVWKKLEKKDTAA